MTSTPVGFVSTTIPAGAVRAVSLALNNPADYAAAVSTVGTTTISTANAAWAANAYGPFSSNPHLVRFLTGAYQGRQFQIDSNTSDTLTLVTNGADLTAAIQPGDRYAVFASATLASVFGATAPSLKTNTDSTQADNVLVRGSLGWLTYYNDGVQWLREGGGTTAQGAPPENATALLPEAGFLFVRRGTTDYSIVAIGAPPMTNLVTDFPANKTLSFANRFPVATTLADFGLAQQPGWNSSTNSTAADNVLVRGSLGWLTYYFDGTKWLREGPNTAENPTIPIDGAVLVVRRAGPDISLNQARPY